MRRAVRRLAGGMASFVVAVGTVAVARTGWLRATMHIDRYLGRIGLSEPPRANLAGLTLLHRAHAFAIPYEAIDIQLGIPTSQDPAAIFDKLVTRRRGGWCYEMNGLLGWALGALGFEVRRAMAGTYRRDRGSWCEGNHVVLIVTLPEGEYLADLGLGDALREPMPLRDGTYSQDGMSFGLAMQADGWWHLDNDPSGLPTHFDFFPGPADEARIEAHHMRLQSDPASIFVQGLRVIGMFPGGCATVLGRTYRRRVGGETVKRLIADPDDLARTLQGEFGIELDGLAELWPRLRARHAELFGDPDAPV